MKCFLHIGTEKTATTTIQKFLATNKEPLLKNGYIYTASVGTPNNYKLPVLAYNRERRDDLTNLCGIYSDPDLLTFKKDVFENLNLEVMSLVKNDPSKTIIFSSEHIQSRLTDISELYLLKERLYALGINDIYVIIYLRSPGDIANSLFSTAIKSGHSSEVPPSPNNSYFANICNHKETLIRFSDVFGESKIIPKIFYKTEFKNGSIIDDFLNIIGIDTDLIRDSFYFPERQNESLSSTAISLLSRINKQIPIFIDNKPNQMRGNIVSFFEKCFKDDKKYTMPKYLYEEYYSAFYESNEWVREKYFPEKKILFPFEYSIESVVDLPEKDLESIASLISSIWLNR